MKKKTETSPIMLQYRDIILFEALAKYRYLKTSRIHELIFDGKSDTAIRRRLAKLYQNNYIDRIFIENPLATHYRGEACYFLDRDGYRVLVEEKGYRGRFHQKNKNVKPIFLNHTLLGIDFRLEVERSIENNTDVLLPQNGWVTEYDMLDPQATKKKDKYILFNEVFDPFNQKKMTLYPDAAFVLNGIGEYKDKQALYFVEIDRGTESSSVISKKLRAYHCFSLSKAFKRYAKVDFFRVLFVTTSLRRVNGIMQNLEGSFGLDLFFFADTAIINESNVITDSIWARSNGEIVPLVKVHV